MKKAIALVWVGVCAVVLAACGGSAPGPAPVTEKPKPLIPASAVPASAPAAASEAPAPMEKPKQPDTAVAPTPAAPADAAADPQLAKLLGTTWTMGDGTELSVKDAKTAHLKGGVVSFLGAGGIDAKFTYTGGKFTISAMGQSKDGTWDGEKLTIDGNEGTKKPQ